MYYYELYNMDNEEKLQQAYLDSLTEKERKGYEIAKSHLRMSFDLEKSIGYLEWKKQNQT